MERTFSLTFLPTHLAPPRVAPLQSLDPPHPPGLSTAASPTSTSPASSQIRGSRSPASEPPRLCWMLPHLPDFLLSLCLAPSTPPFTLSVHPPELFLGIPSYLVPLTLLFLFPCLLVSVWFPPCVLFSVSPPLLLLLNPFLSVPANFPLFFYISLIVLGSLFWFPLISLCRW